MAANVILLSMKVECYRIRKGVITFGNTGLQSTGKGVYY